MKIFWVAGIPMGFDVSRLLTSVAPFAKGIHTSRAGCPLVGAGLQAEGTSRIDAEYACSAFQDTLLMLFLAASGTRGLRLSHGWHRT